MTKAFFDSSGFCGGVGGLSDDPVSSKHRGSLLGQTWYTDDVQAPPVFTDDVIVQVVLPNVTFHLDFLCPEKLLQERFMGLCVLVLQQRDTLSGIFFVIHALPFLQSLNLSRPIHRSHEVTQQLAQLETEVLIGGRQVEIGALEQQIYHGFGQLVRRRWHPEA